jgi:hypothetical protein
MAMVEEDWPELSRSNECRRKGFVTNTNDDDQTDHDDWELLVESQDVSPTRTTGSVCFEKEAIRIDEQDSGILVSIPGTDAATANTNEHNVLKHHYESSPNLGQYIFDDSDDFCGNSVDEASGVLIGDFDVASLASSSVVWVSGSQPVSSWNKSKLSFRDAILQTSASVDTAESGEGPPSTQSQQGVPRIRKLRKPKYVVQPIRRCSKSTGDLKSLSRIVEDDDDHYCGHDSFNNQIMGETDAQEFYSRKSAGKTAHQNGLKTRPDEAKRLQITLDKKEEQRKRQQQASSSAKGK